MPTDPLSTLIGVDMPELHARERRDGVIEFRGRIGPREVEGQYDPLVFHLEAEGRAEDGGTANFDLRVQAHADMAAPFRLLIAWLRGQDQP